MKLVEAQEGRRVARPARRLRGLAGAVAARRRRALRRTSAERRDPPRRRARARAHGVPRRGVLGSRRSLRGARHRRSARGSSSSTVGASPTSRDFDPATGAAGARLRRRCTCARRTPASSSARLARHRRHASRRRRVEAVHRASEAAVQDHDDAAGGGQQAAVQRRTHDVGRAGSLRARVHHLHADRLDEACRTRRSTRPAPRSWSGSARRTSRRRPARTRTRRRTRRRPTRRSARPALGSARPRTCGASCSRDEQAAVRADLDAHGREPDARRPRPQPHAAPRGCIVERGEDAVFRASRPARYEFLGFRMAYVDVSEDPSGADDDEAEPPDGRRGRGRRVRRASTRTATRPSRRRATPRPAW